MRAHRPLVFIVLALAVGPLAQSQSARSGGGASAQLLQQMQQLASERTSLQSENAKLKKDLEDLRKERDTLKNGQQALDKRAKASEAAVRNLDAQIALQQPVIEQGTADVTAAEANLQFAQEERARYDGLMKTGSGTVQRAQQTDATLRASNAQLQHSKSGLQAAERKVDVLATDRTKAVAQVDHARAVEQQAALNLS